MKITTSHQSIASQRAREIVQRIDLSCAAERQRVDPETGKARRRYSGSSKQMLATFRYRDQADLTVDKNTGEVQSYMELNQGGRSSFFYGGTFRKVSHSLRVKDGVKEYQVTTRNFDENQAVAKTETVRVGANGIESFHERQHLEGKTERFYRANPSIRSLVMMAGGASIGLMGTFLATNSPVAAALGACTGAGLGAGLARRRPVARGSAGTLEMVAAPPVKVLEFAAGVGTLGALGALLLQA